jgi:hypothetical protein
MNILARQILSFLLFIGLQVLLFNHLTIFQIATPYIFLLPLIMLPPSTSMPAMLLIGFATGLTVDVLSDTYANGLHAFGCLMIAGVRQRTLSVLSTSNVRTVGELSFREQNPVWMAAYISILILVHHLAYFYLEAFTFRHFFHTFLKVMVSGAYTFVFCYLLSLTFYKR